MKRNRQIYSINLITVWYLLILFEENDGFGVETNFLLIHMDQTKALKYEI